MAIFIAGVACGLCRGTLASDELETFAAFIGDRLDPLHVFSDGCFHRACVDAHPLGAEARAWQQRALDEPRPRRCNACGEVIVDPDDYFGTGLLARGAEDPLHAFNFVHLHRSHAASWPRFAQLRAVLDAAIAAGRWGGGDFGVDEQGRPAWKPR